MPTAKRSEPGPRDLFLDPADVPVLRERVRLPVFRDSREEWRTADREADRRFLASGVALNDHWNHMARVCRILTREAFVFLASGEGDRGALAAAALGKLLEYPKWDYFLEAGRDVIGLQMAPYAVQSIVIAYPWIEALLTEPVRRETLAQLASKGCEPCRLACWGMLHKEDVKGWSIDPESLLREKRDMRKWPWILARTNLRAVPMSSLGLGALFLAGTDPRASGWLETVRETFEDFRDVYDADGSYPEGTGYASYTSGEMIPFLHALERRTGEDWTGAVNWRGLMDFALGTRMPSARHPDGHVNFGDGGSGLAPDVGFWVARKLRYGPAQYYALHHAGKHRIFSPLFYDPTVEPVAPAAGLRLHRFGIGWVVASEGPEKDDFLVALRSGGPANHEHADRNSLILKCLGEDLLVDRWHVPYDNKHPAWSLRTSPAHNTVLVDGRGHQYHDGAEGTNPSDAAAAVVRAESRGTCAVAESDATQAYRLVDGNVGRVTRSFLAAPALRLLVVVDRLRAAGRPADFRARWHLDNEDGEGRMEVDGCRFLFHRPGARLAGIAASNRGVRLEEGRFPVPAEHGTFPFLDVAAAEAAVETVLCAAFAAAGPGGPLPTLEIESAKDGWRLRARTERGEAVVDIVPEPDGFRMELRPV